MNEKKFDFTTNLIILVFFTLFLGGPGSFFYTAFELYNLKNLPVLTENDFNSAIKGDIIKGLVILDGEKVGDKLASQFIIPIVRNYRIYNLIEPVTLDIQNNKKQLVINQFPDRFDYGPELMLFYNALIDKPQLENTIKSFGQCNNVGRIVDNKNVDAENKVKEYLVIYDSIADNKAKIIDTIAIDLVDFQNVDSNYYSFDTLNFSNSISEFEGSLYEIGLAVGDTIVGEFKIENLNQITPERIYCYGKPNFIWDNFIRNNIYFFIICSILIIIPIFLLINMIKKKIKEL